MIAVAPATHMDDYLASLKEAGADWLRLDYGRHDPAEVLSSVRGVILLGGADVDPRYYGEARHTTFQAAVEGRDEYEIALAREAVRRDVPLLAICRGLQLLNVALGGTLVQDIPSQIAQPLPHGQPSSEPKDKIAHVVSVERGSRLADILAPVLDSAGNCPVNSRHHQAVKDAGEGIVISARSGDGVVEAAERPASRFCVGVQWHPENFRTAREFGTLFESFVAATRGASRAE
jgi:putative glutamine amidotransferase